MPWRPLPRPGFLFSCYFMGWEWEKYVSSTQGIKMGESRTKKIAQGHTRSLKSAQKQNPGPLTPSQWQVPVNHVSLEGSGHPHHNLMPPPPGDCGGHQDEAEIWVRRQHGCFWICKCVLLPGGRGSGEGNCSISTLWPSPREAGLASKKGSVPTDLTALRSPVTRMNADNSSLLPKPQRGSQKETNKLPAPSI